MVGLKRILTFFLIVYLISAGYSARASIGKVYNNLKEYLTSYDISFLIKADLNNDGKQEKITLYRQWDGEGWWSDDQWYILCIFDENDNTIYKNDVSYFQEVGSIAVKDNDGDGFKEVIVSLDQSQYWNAITQIYGWREHSQKFVKF